MEDWRGYVINEDACRRPIFTTTVNTYVRYSDPTVQAVADMLAKGKSLFAIREELGIDHELVIAIYDYFAEMEDAYFDPESALSKEINDTIQRLSEPQSRKGHDAFYKMMSQKSRTPS